MRKCDSCGKFYQESKDVFCPHCGAVAQKQCTHGSSFDSKRYDRGEIYKNNNTQYQNTTYTKSSEPHAQRVNQPYKSYESQGDEVKLPKINLPDLTKTFSKGTSGEKATKPVVIIIFVVIIAFNFITGILNTNDDGDVFSGYETATEYEEDINELYTVVDEAIIELVDTDGDFKIFTLEISGMGFDDYLPQNMKNDITSGAMTEKILSEETLVEMMFCNFSKDIVAEESYNNALADSYYYPGKQIGGKCKYEFSYNFEYGEIVHIASGMSFYLNNGKYINAELPFSAFSIYKTGIITYYTSYADSETAWNTVFSECSNQQDISRDLYIDFDAGE